MIETMSTQIASVFETDLGWIALVGTEFGGTRLAFGFDRKREAAQSLGIRKCEPWPLAWLADAEALLRRYAAGEDVDLSAIPLDLECRTPFRGQVRRVVRGIPFGETRSYGAVAELAGRPQAARAVGTVMSSNPVPLLIPCHRVVGAGGALGGYSAPQGLDMKRRLLELERRGAKSRNGRNS